MFVIKKKLHCVFLPNGADISENECLQGIIALILIEEHVFLVNKKPDNPVTSLKYILQKYYYSSVTWGTNFRCFRR